MPGGIGPLPFGFGGTPGTPVPQRGASLRRFTQQQFANLTAIVGSVLDRALQDLNQRYNNLQPQDQQSRWLPNTYVWGYSPMQTQVGVVGQYPMMLPWMYARNAASTVQLDNGASNEARLRNTFNPGIPWRGQSTDRYNGNQFVWQNSLYFERAVRLSAVNVTMLSARDRDGALPAYDNPWQYPDTGAWLQDMYLDLSVDNAWYGDRRQTLSTTEVQMTQLNAYQMAFAPYKVEGLDTALQGQPPYPESLYDPYGGSPVLQYAPQGVSMDARNLNILIPERSTVRLSVIVPAYPARGGVQDYGWNTTSEDKGYQVYPWSNQVYSMSLHTLEAMR